MDSLRVSQLAQMIDSPSSSCPAAPRAGARVPGSARVGHVDGRYHPADIQRCLGLLQAAQCAWRHGGFPAGAEHTAREGVRSRGRAERGAHELDMVINVRALQARRAGCGARQSTRATLCRSGGNQQVILETCYLDEAKGSAARCAWSGVDS